MAGQRTEPFQRALNGLRERLRVGDYPPGSRITATDVADDLRLSATPVREALSRLAGEGLVEDRRGQGFFIRPLAAVDVADLYRLSLAHLLIALAPHRTSPRRVVPGPPAGQRSFDPAEPVSEIERLFAIWVGEAASRTLAIAFRAVQVQLGPIRRLEPLLIADLEAEAAQLQALDPADLAGERLPRIRQFHARRLRLADRLAALRSQPGGLAQL